MSKIRQFRIFICFYKYTQGEFRNYPKILGKKVIKRFQKRKIVIHKGKGEKLW